MKTPNRLALSAAILLSIGYVAAAVFFYTMQREFVFPGQHKKLTESPISRRPDAEAYRVATASGAIDAWFFPPIRPAGRAPVLIFSHGNGEVIDQWVDDFDEFRRWGLGVFLVEYPGYGRSAGEPSETAVQEALVKAYDVLINREDVDKDRIIGYGLSLGGGAVCALARAAAAGRHDPPIDLHEPAHIRSPVLHARISAQRPVRQRQCPSHLSRTRPCPARSKRRSHFQP